MTMMIMTTMMIDRTAIFYKTFWGSMKLACLEVSAFGEASLGLQKEQKMVIFLYPGRSVLCTPVRAYTMGV